MSTKKVLAPLLVVLILAGWGCSSNKETTGDNDKTVAPGDDQTVTIPTATTTATTPAPAKGKTTITAPTKALTYAAALDKYRGAVMQFVNCRVLNGTFTLKKGVSFMLDNRDSIAHTIKIQGKSYRLGGYSFAIATPLTVGNSFVTCDGGGSGEVRVQN